MSITRWLRQQVLNVREDDLAIRKRLASRCTCDLQYLGAMQLDLGSNSYPHLAPCPLHSDRHS